MCAVYNISNCLIEDGIVEWFREIDFGKYIKKFVESGYNQFSEIAIITEDQMKTIVSQSINTRSILCPNCILILYSYNTLHVHIRPIVIHTQTHVHHYNYYIQHN